MFKIQPRDVSALIRKARRSSHLTMQRLSEISGVSLSAVHRYESKPMKSMARVVSVLLALGFELSSKNGEIRLPVEQAAALRRLLRQAREAVLRGDVSPGMILALEEVNRTRAGYALARALRQHESTQQSGGA